MKNREAFEIFAESFVLPDFRERFIHEALKKPRKLHERICHRISEVFPAQYQDQRVPFTPNGPCLLIGRDPAYQEITWSEAEAKVGLGGILIIDMTGHKFYAETEGEPRIHTWAGVC